MVTGLILPGVSRLRAMSLWTMELARRNTPPWSEGLAEFGGTAEGTVVSSPTILVFGLRKNSLFFSISCFLILEPAVYISNLQRLEIFLSSKISDFFVAEIDAERRISSSSSDSCATSEAATDTNLNSSSLGSPCGCLNLMKLY